MSALLAHTRRTSIGFAIGLLLVTVSKGADATSIPPDLARQLVALGFSSMSLGRDEQDHLTIQTHINSRARILVIDTGWSVTTLDDRVAVELKTADELGIKARDWIFRRFEPAELKIVADFRVGSIECHEQPVLTRALRRGGGVKQDGILGGDFLLGKFCLIDCAQRRFYARETGLIRENQTVLADFLRSQYAEVLLEPVELLVFGVRAEMNGEPVKLLIDSGASASVLDQGAVERVHLNHSEKRGRVIRGVGKIGASWLYQGKVNSLRLGEVTVTNLDFAVADLSRWGMSGKPNKARDVDGLLGVEFLSRNGSIIDYQSRKLWVRKSPR